MANQMWRREVELKQLNTGWHDAFTETLKQRRLNGSQKCHVHKCLKIVTQKHDICFVFLFVFTYNSISATYIKPSLLCPWFIMI